MVFYTGLARLARDAGLVVREVNGWKTRTLGTRPKGMAGARGCLWHHTATSASAVKARNNPTLNYMVNGLGYPLANFGLAWDGSIDVIAAGAAAHAGKGRYGSRIPQNQGNDYLLGVEVEGTVGLTWSDAQLESAARLGHAMNKEWGSSFLQIGHLEYAPTRKVDPSGIPGGMPALRKAIARGYWKNKNWKPGGKVTTGSSNSKPKPAAKPKPKPASKSIGKMASEVIAGHHGTGHENRRRSLGVSQSVYNQVRAEVNRRAGGSTARPASKSVSQMASEVIAGKHGNGHANRQRSLGVNNATYAKVRAEVNRRS